MADMDKIMADIQEEATQHFMSESITVFRRWQNMAEATKQPWAEHFEKFRKEYAARAQRIIDELS